MCSCLNKSWLQSTTNDLKVFFCDRPPAVDAFNLEVAAVDEQSAEKISLLFFINYFVVSVQLERNNQIQKKAHTNTRERHKHDTIRDVFTRLKRKKINQRWKEKVT